MDANKLGLAIEAAAKRQLFWERVNFWAYVASASIIPVYLILKHFFGLFN